MEEEKVSSPEASGSVCYMRLPPASLHSAHPSLNTRVTLACFVHRSMRQVAIAAVWWTSSSTGRGCSQHQRSVAAQHASEIK